MPGCPPPAPGSPEPPTPVCVSISSRTRGRFTEPLCWESTGLSLGLALAAVEEAMIHAANKQEVTGFNML